MIFITGISGFVGSNLAEYLINNGMVVSGLIRDESKKEGLNEAIKFHIGDIRDSGIADLSLAGTEYFIHCASVINPPDQKDSTVTESNIKGTINVLNWVKNKAGSLKKFIYISSVGAMGKIHKPPVDESYSGEILNTYQMSKRESEFIVRDFCASNNIDYIILRPAWIYGPRDRRVFKFIKAIAKKRFLRIGDCRTFIHPLYIDDLLDAIYISVKSDIKNDLFVIAGPEMYTIDQTIDIISKHLNVKIPGVKLPYSIMYIIALFSEFFFPLIGMEAPIFRRRLDFFKENQGFDISKSVELLSYSPKYYLERGMSETIDWYRDNKWL